MLNVQNTNQDVHLHPTPFALQKWKGLVLIFKPWLTKDLHTIYYTKLENIRLDEYNIYLNVPIVFTGLSKN